MSDNVYTPSGCEPKNGGAEPQATFINGQIPGVSPVQSAPLFVEDGIRYAGFFPRLGAYIVDSVVAGVPCALLLAAEHFTVLGDIAALTTPVFFTFNAIDILSYLLFTGYFVLLTEFTGVTLGKKLFSLKIISSAGRLTWLDAVYRETVGRFLSSILLIGYLVLAFDKKHRAFHDMLCDTRVVFDM